MLAGLVNMANGSISFPHSTDREKPFVRLCQSCKESFKMCSLEMQLK